jgi:hypothetical protein
MARGVKVDECVAPADIGVLGATTVVLELNALTQPIQQLN